jgi:hypothetical protein
MEAPIEVDAAATAGQRTPPTPSVAAAPALQTAMPIR